MIILRKKEDIEIYQVELALKIKTKQSPFISVLIFAQETGEISAEDLNKNLLTSLPVKACYNLLKRLEQQGYLDSDDRPDITEDQIREVLRMHNYNQERAEKYLDNLVNESRNINASFTLTELGEQSAKEKSYWIGEKGVYNVYVSHSNFIQQQIIKTEKIERAEDDKGNRIINTPREILQFESQILNICTNETLIEDVEKKCFQLKSADSVLEIQSIENECQLKLSADNQLLFQTNIDLIESDLQEQILSSASNEFEYHPDHKAILLSFSKDNTSLNRKVRITKPLFKQFSFDPVELENITHIPKDQYSAELWYLELLYKNIDRYFLDENSFVEFASEIAKPILQFYKVKIPKRKELGEMFSEREDAFYQTAKLETIDYIRY